MFPNATVASPANLQSQSALLSLPGEIKNKIYRFCLTGNGGAFIDVVPGDPRPTDGAAPVVGMNVLRTCRKAYHECDRRPLFTDNRYTFTTAGCCQRFFDSLGDAYSPYVRDVEISTCRIRYKDPDVFLAWCDYFGQKDRNPAPNSLRAQACKLRSLRLNVETCPDIDPTFPPLCLVLLQTLAKEIGGGLERFVVVGGMGVTKEAPWAPSQFFTGANFLTFNVPVEMIKMMWPIVDRVDDDQKVIRWKRKGKKMHLEVVSKRYLLEYVDEEWTGVCVEKKSADAWPESGSCTWYTYQNRNFKVADAAVPRINPSAAG